MALTVDRPGRPGEALIRAALNNWAFSKNSRDADGIPAEVERALSWVARNSMNVADLSVPKTMRVAVKAVTTKLDGKKAALSSRHRNHGILSAALDYAVSQGLLAENPIEPLEAASAKGVHQVDKRCVVNPAQADRLLTAVGEYGRPSEQHKSGPRLVAFHGRATYGVRKARRTDSTMGGASSISPEPPPTPVRGGPIRAPRATTGRSSSAKRARSARFRAHLNRRACSGSTWSGSGPDPTAGSSSVCREDR
ncbi:hypothetical protein ACFQZU_05790 [Streptomonospora algeriensis]|uniref:Core-binding (CB) domain-containing protein n=1 Tax=Streptomonospora algeriensis TaxID=995084 RepID=A0ABW3BCP3_9ACTN